MFMNEIKSRGSVHQPAVYRPFTYIVNWNSYQIKALITLDYLFFFYFFGVEQEVGAALKSVR
jgi:hypothetical protein